MVGLHFFLISDLASPAATNRSQQKWFFFEHRMAGQLARFVLSLFYRPHHSP